MHDKEMAERIIDLEVRVKKLEELIEILMYDKHNMDTNRAKENLRRLRS